MEKLKQNSNINNQGEGEKIIPMIWHCNECNFDFGNPIIDAKTDEMHCPYCGSRQIEKEKTI